MGTEYNIDDGSELLSEDWGKLTEEEIKKIEEKERKLFRELDWDYPEEEISKKPSDKDENGHEMKMVLTREDEIERLKRLKDDYVKMQERGQNQGIHM